MNAITVHVPADDDHLTVTYDLPVAQLYGARGTPDGMFRRYAGALVEALAENLNAHAFGAEDVLHLELRLTRERR